jgi:hypothetical protein
MEFDDGTQSEEVMVATDASNNGCRTRSQLRSKYNFLLEAFPHIRPMYF